MNLRQNNPYSCSQQNCTHFDHVNSAWERITVVHLQSSSEARAEKETSFNLLSPTDHSGNDF